MSTIKKTELEGVEKEGLEEKHSEIAQQTEESKEKLIQVYLSPEQYEQYMDIQNYYRSPGISHTLRLLIEDVHKGLKMQLYPQMVKILHEKTIGG